MIEFHLSGRRVQRANIGEVVHVLLALCATDDQVWYTLCGESSLNHNPVRQATLRNVRCIQCEQQVGK